jgi:hypothetical protein
MLGYQGWKPWLAVKRWCWSVNYPDGTEMATFGFASSVPSVRFLSRPSWDPPIRQWRTYNRIVDHVGRDNCVCDTGFPHD